MKGKNVVLLALMLLMIFSVHAKGGKEGAQTGASSMSLYEMDKFEIKGKTLTILFVGHGTLMMEYNKKVIHIDPVASVGDYSNSPAGDLILVTHQHGDHLDAGAIAKITKKNTVLIANVESAKALTGAVVMKNGDQKNVAGIGIEAVPAYNTTAGREGFHPQGRDNGYILNFDGFRVYVAGDTEVNEDILQLRNIDVAFLPMNQPYTMLPEQVANVAKAIRPLVLYPYHYGQTDPNLLVELLKNEPGIELRIRKMQ